MVIENSKQCAGFHTEGGGGGRPGISPPQQKFPTPQDFELLTC